MIKEWLKADWLQFSLSSQYNKALQERGSVTLWLSDDVIKAWYENKKKKARQQGRQFKYSDVAIQAALMVKMVFRLTYRSLAGFLKSIVSLMGVALDIPDYTSICRRVHSLEIPGFNNIPSNEHINILNSGHFLSPTFYLAQK